jgi:hypothetical protein
VAEINTVSLHPPHSAPGDWSKRAFISPPFVSKFVVVAAQINTGATDLAVRLSNASDLFSVVLQAMESTS